MGDLTIASAPTCLTNESWSTKHKGLGGVYVVSWGRVFGREVQYDWSCTCKAFEKRGQHCKHIREVITKKLRCGWNEILEPTAKATAEHKCPQCGGAVQYVRVGV